MADDGRFKIEKFDGSNFNLWKMQIEDYLYQKDLYLPLDGVEKKPSEIKDEQWRIFDRKALGLVRLSLASSVLFNVSKETTTKGLMDALSQMYEKPSAANKVFLMQKLFDMRMAESGNVLST